VTCHTSRALFQTPISGKLSTNGGAGHKPFVRALLSDSEARVNGAAHHSNLCNRKGGGLLGGFGDKRTLEELEELCEPPAMYCGGCGALQALEELCGPSAMPSAQILKFTVHTNMCTTAYSHVV
jgi:hypothetical protein